MKSIFTFALATLCLAAGAQKKQRLYDLPLPAAKTQTVAPNYLYSFLTYTAPYLPITGTSLTNGKKWDEAFYLVPIGFQFKFYNRKSTSIYIIGGSGVSFENPGSPNSAMSMASPLDEDLCDRSFDPDTDNENDPGGTSSITYTTVGATPNRICYIQVSNAGFFGEIDSLHASTSYANFQIRLFESSNKIEFHYGDCNVQRPDLNLSGGQTGEWTCRMMSLVFLPSFWSTGNVLTGSASAPTMTGFDPNAATAPMLSGPIENGRVYQFIHTPTIATSIAENETVGFSVYPNPAKGKVKVTAEHPDLLQQSTAELYDLTGRSVGAELIAGEINVSGLQQGIYILKVRSAEGIELHTSKLVIAE